MSSLYALGTESVAYSVCGWVGCWRGGDWGAGWSSGGGGGSGGGKVYDGEEEIHNREIVMGGGMRVVMGGVGEEVEWLGWRLGLR
jgi:hypothetical protein